jgi:hypothetical protein
MEWEQPGQRRRRHLTRLHANGSSHPARRTNRCTQRASGPAAECSGTPYPISPNDARGVSSVEKALLLRGPPRPSFFSVLRSPRPPPHRRRMARWQRDDRSHRLSKRRSAHATPLRWPAGYASSLDSYHEISMSLPVASSPRAAPSLHPARAHQDAGKSCFKH